MYRDAADRYAAGSTTIDWLTAAGSRCAPGDRPPLARLWPDSAGRCEQDRGLRVGLRSGAVAAHERAGSAGLCGGGERVGAPSAAGRGAGRLSVRPRQVRQVVYMTIPRGRTPPSPPARPARRWKGGRRSRWSSAITTRELAGQGPWLAGARQRPGAGDLCLRQGAHARYDQALAHEDDPAGRWDSKQQQEGAGYLQQGEEQAYPLWRNVAAGQRPGRSAAPRARDRYVRAPQATITGTPARAWPAGGSHAVRTTSTISAWQASVC